MTDQTRPINVIFDGPPDHESGRFVEVETDDGHGIKVGEWIERTDGTWALRITELPSAPSSSSSGGMGTLTPSVVSPYDTALRGLRAAVDKAVDSEVRPADMFRAVIMGLRRLTLGGHREQLEGYVFEALVTEHPSPLAGMLLEPGQAYADRGNYAVVSVTRREDNSIDVDVVP